MNPAPVPQTNDLRQHECIRRRRPQHEAHGLRYRPPPRSCGFLQPVSVRRQYRLVNEARPSVTSPSPVSAAEHHTVAQPRRQGYPRCGPRVTCATRATRRLSLPEVTLRLPPGASRISNHCGGLVARRLPSRNRSGRVRHQRVTEYRWVLRRPASSCPAPDARQRRGNTRQNGDSRKGRPATGSVQVAVPACLQANRFYTHSCIPRNKVRAHFKHKTRGAPARWRIRSRFSLTRARPLFLFKSSSPAPPSLSGRASYPVFQSPRSPPPPTPSTRTVARSVVARFTRSVRYARHSLNTFFNAGDTTRRSYLQ